MWYYYVAFVTGEGRLQSCRIDSRKELSAEEQAATLPKAIYNTFGTFTAYTCVYILRDPTASILVQGGTVLSVFTTIPGLSVEVFDLDLVGDGTTCKEQELRGNLTAGKSVEVGITNHYDTHG